MEHEQEMVAQQRVQALADTVGLVIDPDRLPALAVAFDGARLVIAQLEELARRVNVPVSAAYDAAWSEGEDQR